MSNLFLILSIQMFLGNEHERNTLILLNQTSIHGAQKCFLASQMVLFVVSMIDIQPFERA